MDAASHIRTIAKRELTSYFASPVAYVFIVIFLLLAGFFTFMVGGFFERNEAALSNSFFVWHPWLYLFLVPAVGMRLWSEEQRLGTLELLLTYPINPWHAIIGKFIASWLILGVSLALTFPIVITVAYLGSPDLGSIFTGYIGSFLLAGAYLAIASATSAMTRNQVISFIIAVVICLFLILAGFPPVTSMATSSFPNAVWLVDAISSLSVVTNFEAFQKGVIDSRNVLFFFSLIIFGLVTTGFVLRTHRS